ncbi:LysE family translocator [Leeia oryzae]|uniref:LysE family translocator n=1 Tax=Leeia oryzae TaxID=356662 RepID=UPI00036D0772|nr:LysE family translocator [Leeia oryzae]
MDAHTLWLFTLSVSLLLLSPGPNMMFVLAHGMAFGASGSLAAAGGIALADIVLSLLTAAGISSVVATWPTALLLMKATGAIYLLYLAWQVYQRPARTTETGVAESGLHKVCLHAMLNSLLNPKALLFFMVFLPQFVQPDAGPVWRQLLLLGGLLTLLAFVFHALLGLAGQPVRRWLQRFPRAANTQRYLLMTVLLGLAGRLVFSS